MQRKSLDSQSVKVGTAPINSVEHLFKVEESRDAASISCPEFAQSLSKAKTQTSVVQCNGQDVKIHAIQTGLVAVKRSHLTNRTAHFFTPIKISLDRNFTEFMPIWVWAIEHPEGVIVIDTGENAEVMRSDYFQPAGELVAMYSRRNLRFKTRKENEIGVQLTSLGISNADIKNVVLTHLHLDHTDGLKDFRNVEILLNEDEYAKPSGHFPELLPDWFRPKTVRYKNDLIEEFHQAYPITKAEDVLMIPTNGHTYHHASVIFKTDDFDILFAGDVCYNQRQLIDNDLPGINASYRKSQETYDNIKTYAKKRSLIFLPSHDMDSAERLREKQFLI